MKDPEIVPQQDRKLGEYSRYHHDDNSVVGGHIKKGFLKAERDSKTELYADAIGVLVEETPIEME